MLHDDDDESDKHLEARDRRYSFLIIESDCISRYLVEASLNSVANTKSPVKFTVITASKCPSVK